MRKGLGLINGEIKKIELSENDKKDKLKVPNKVGIRLLKILIRQFLMV